MLWNESAESLCDRKDDLNDYMVDLMKTIDRAAEMFPRHLQNLEMMMREVQCEASALNGEKQ